MSCSQRFVFLHKRFGKKNAINEIKNYYKKVLQCSGFALFKKICPQAQSNRSVQFSSIRRYLRCITQESRHTNATAVLGLCNHKNGCADVPLAQQCQTSHHRPHTKHNTRHSTLTQVTGSTHTTSISLTQVPTRPTQPPPPLQQPCRLHQQQDRAGKKPRPGETRASSVKPPSASIPSRGAGD